MSNERQFILCGHRGNMAEAPENTLSGFASAEHVGVDEIELDVRTTRDGVLVVVHDRTVARTAAKTSLFMHTPIEQLTLDELRTVDLGGGEQIPTFQEALDATSVLLQVEIKAPSAARPLAEFLKDRPQRDRDRCVVTSFEPLSLADYTDVWSETPRGTALHVPDASSNWRDDAQRLGVSALLFPLSTLQRPLVDELHDQGYIVAASLIEGPGEVRRLLELDVDMSASNAPEYARRMLLGSDEFQRKYPDFAATTHHALEGRV